MKNNTNIQLGCGLIRIGRKWGFKQNNIPTEEEVQKFLQSAITLGIKFFDTAPAYGLSEKRLGIFLNSERNEMKEVIKKLTKAKKKILINRPLNMGNILYKNQDEKSKYQFLVNAYNFILKEKFSGVVLTGTCNIDHLKENYKAFAKTYNHSYKK